MSTDRELAAFRASVEQASEFLKALGNPNRLTILCLLAQEELNVGQLEETLGIRQPTLSQQLAVLRDQELVTTRRDGKEIYYSLASPEVRDVIAILYRRFCKPGIGVDTEKVMQGLAERFATPSEDRV